MNIDTAPHHNFPHQIADEVLPADLAQDFSENPEAYHPDLHPHIREFLSRSDMSNVDGSEIDDNDNADYNAARLLEDEMKRAVREARDGGDKLSNEVVRYLIETDQVATLVNSIDDIADYDDEVIRRIISDGYKNFVIDKISVSSSLSTERYTKITYDLMELSIATRATYVDVLAIANDTRLKLDDIQFLINYYIDINGIGTIAYSFDEISLPLFIKYDMLQHAIASGRVEGLMRASEDLRGFMTRDDQKRIINLVLEQTHGSDVIRTVSDYGLLTSEDKSEIFEKLLIPANILQLYCYHDHFPSPTREQQIRIMSMMLDRASDQGGVVYIALRWMQDMDALTTEEKHDIILSLSTEDTIRGVVAGGDETLRYLSKEECQQVATTAIENDCALEVARWINQYGRLSDETYVRLFADLKTNHEYEVINETLEYFHGIDKVGYVIDLIENHDTQQLTFIPPAVLRQISKDDRMKNCMREIFDDAQDLFRLEGNFDAYYILAQNASIDSVDEIDRVFGKYASHAAMGLIQTLHEAEEVTGILENEECRALGITAAGQEGIAQLKERVDVFIGKFLACEVDQETLRALRHSEALRGILARVTDFNTTEWGETSDSNLMKMINNHNIAIHDGWTKTPGETTSYETSGPYAIDRISANDDGVEWLEDAENRYAVLLKDMSAAREALEQPGGFRNLLTELRGEIGTVLSRLEADLQVSESSSETNARRLHNLKTRRDALRKYVEEIDGGISSEQRFVMNSPTDFRRGFQELQIYKELHPTMRKFIFAWAMRKNPEYIDKIRRLPSDISAESAVTTCNFVEKIVNKQTYDEYFTDKKDANRFKQLSSTKALEEALFRHQQTSEHRGVTDIQFIPTRGLLMEMSGQIASACWADMYSSIAQEFPQISAVIMKARPGKKNERIVGAALFIETTDVNTGEDVLVLRGTNPTENYINKVDVAGFYNAIVDYTKAVAAATARRPAIVIDDHSGGAGTNRPVLYEYMDGQRSSLGSFVADKKTAEFNGYTLEEGCYYLA